MEIAAVTEVLKEYLGMGVEVQKFEAEIEQYLGGNIYAVCVANGTAALQIALQVRDVGIGDEVIVPSLTYVASFQAISATGAYPVACDVDLNTGFICSKSAERLITGKTKAIMPVLAGSCKGIDQIYELASRYDLAIIEDAAHSFGSKYQNSLVGTFGQTTCFSFDGIKNITCGEGGAIVFDDPIAADMARDARLLGVRKDTDNRFKGERSWDFDVIAQGWRYHMSNVMAAIGRVQLSRIDEFVLKRQEIARSYCEHLKFIPDVSVFDFDYSEICTHIFPIKVSQKIS